ncbi:FUSC family protein [Arsenicicoccus dermatophilus]|uniref:FUSC family protein n=1 Tax=Arsenicicoccus dermatophilus TaxID=1076331 RepID=UPI001F4C809A|nr:aromatic acid exporter family protein [Arsenicicoccus dermatophilus]MCH8614312.1 aromatic acid exporter family protein [Arsenicicoccus dermatophilus]
MTAPRMPDLGPGSGVRRLLRRVWPGGPRTWAALPRRLRPTAMHTGRLTVAGVLGYVLTVLLTDGTVDLTGALTALLVCQASTLSTIRMGMVRVGAVVTGVLVAVLISSQVGLTWWSLGLAIATSLLLAKVFRLGDQALETPISAMLILSAGGQEIAVATRLITTLIGAGVGVGINLAFPPQIPTRAAISSVRWVAVELADGLDRMAEGLALAPVLRADVERWLDSVRRVSGSIARASNLVETVRDARKLNARALGSRSLEPPLRSGLDRLEQCQTGLRNLLLLMVEAAPEGFTRDDGYGEDVRVAFSVVLSDVAECLRTFGDLVAAEARGDVDEVERQLEQALETLGETRAVLTELMMVDPAETGQWMLRGTILAGVEQVLVLLAVGVRRRERERWPGAPPAAALVPLVREALPDWRGQRRSSRPTQRARSQEPS